MSEIKTETLSNQAVDSKNTSIPSAEEILGRIQKTTDTKVSTDITLDDLKLNANDLSQIKDPIARKMVEDRYKQWESGFNKKFEQLANTKKELEAKVTQAQSSGQFQGWSKDRIREALKDPSFVSSVQALQQESAPQNWEGSSEEWSALNTQEKAQFQQLNQVVRNQQAQLNNILQSQEDEILRKKYPNYNPEKVNKLWSDFMSGTVQATREDIWKVANHSEDIQRAYQLGLQDRKLDITEKVNASSSTATMNMSSADVVPDEIKKQGFGAIGRWRLAQFRGKS